MNTEVFYVGNYGPLTANVYENDGVTPAAAQSATIDIVHQETGTTVLSGGSGDVSELGKAVYLIPEDADYMLVPGHYIGFMHVVLSATEKKSIPLSFVVLDLSAYLVVQTWQRKVEKAAPSELDLRDEVAREWIDDAVNFLNDRYETGYTSVLGGIDPIPEGNTIEFIANVASLLARWAWWAGKGNWRDDEISFDGTPFATEWARLERVLTTVSTSSLYDAGGDMYNRDHAFSPGLKVDGERWYEDDVIPVP